MSNKTVLSVCSLLILCGLIGEVRASKGYWGKFVPLHPTFQVGLPDERSDGRPTFVLTEPFTFEDANEQSWVAEVGFPANGASIPKVAWSIIGAPMSGPYLHASIIHDYFVRHKTRTPSATHRAFYDGMLVNGVPGWKAKAMYFAVLLFGDDWVLTETGAEDIKDAVDTDELPPNKQREIEHLLRQAMSSLEESDGARLAVAPFYFPAANKSYLLASAETNLRGNLQECFPSGGVDLCTKMIGNFSAAVNKKTQKLLFADMARVEHLVRKAGAKANAVYFGEGKGDGSAFAIKGKFSRQDIVVALHSEMKDKVFHFDTVALNADVETLQEAAIWIRRGPLFQ